MLEVRIVVIHGGGSDKEYSGDFFRDGNILFIDLVTQVCLVCENSSTSTFNNVCSFLYMIQ
jgi:hypothetical protein